ncbi:choice-of-anchor O protein [Desulfococcaceae bacterium HSG7]|nr:choice-of-anchor O protein [Desulfococcaceae bacterium HSG7]
MKRFTKVLVFQLIMLLMVGAAFADVKVNVSNTPTAPDAKAKLNMATCWIPAMDADGNSVEIENYNEDGEFIEGRTKAKPLVTSYVGETANGVHDVFGAVSRDEGQTWQITNLSESANKTSFTLANGEPDYGHCRKPVFQVKSNRIFVVWSSRYAAEGSPRYEDEGDPHDMGINEEPAPHGQQQGQHPEPLTGQQSVDYTDMGFSDVGEVAYSVAWGARGVIITGGMLGTPTAPTPWRTAGYKVGDIVWFKAERLTSGVRDANQLFAGGAGGAGFAFTWQEDPLGLRPGKADGPGHGWGGAITSNKTDIWYSYLTWADMLKTPSPIPGPGEGRPASKIKMSLPVRLSDNVPQNTGGGRPNCFLQAYTVNPSDPLCDQTKSAWAMIGYAERRTNPLGKQDPMGPASVDEGKSAMYHTFEFTKPLEDPLDPDANVRAGNIVNLQKTDEDGNLLWLKDWSGNYILDENGDQLPAYYNSRRPRFVMQGKSAKGPSGTVMIIIYKSSLGDCGYGSDIMMRRCVVPAGPAGMGNPYKFANFHPGEQNMSATTVTQMGFAGLRALEWEQTPANLNDKPEDNPLDDSRAHRGGIRGDFVAFGYTYTPNLAMAQKGYDTYNFYIRRSFDGGQTWTTDPDGTGAVEHTEKFYQTCSLDTETVTTTYGPGEFEPARNMSLITVSEDEILNQTVQTVIEPRLVAVPGSITKTNPSTHPTAPCAKVKTDYAEDIQDQGVFYMTWATKYFFTGVEGRAYFSFTRDQGQTLGRWEFESLSGDSTTGLREAECQIRMTPDGSKFYAAWLEETETTSDIAFRRILPSEFPGNQPNRPIATIDSPAADVIINAGGSVDFAGSVSNGTAPFTFEWDFDGDNVADSSDEIPGEVTFATDGTYNVTFKVTDGNGYEDSASVIVTVGEILNAAIFVEDAPASEISVATGSEVIFQGAATGGQEPYSFGWTLAPVSDPSSGPGVDDDPGMPSQGGVYPSTFTYTFDTEGTFQITLDVTDDISDTDSHYVLVTVADAVVTQVGIISGNVLDADGDPVQNVEVTLDKNEMIVLLASDVYTDALSAYQQLTGLSLASALDFPRSTFTNSRGYYEFTDLPEGNYTVSVGEDVIVPSVDVELTDKKHRRRVRFKMRGDCVGEGDMDGDCDVDWKDLKLHKKYWGEDPSSLSVVADLDGDGDIDKRDSYKILKQIYRNNR